LATKQIDPSRPGQAYIWLDDLLREALPLTELQFKALVCALAHEWRTGKPPTREQWRRFVRVPNGAKRQEVDDLAEGYAVNPVRLSLMDERARQIAVRTSKAAGQAKRTDRKAGQQMAESSASESVSASASESLSGAVKLNEINETARKNDEKLRYSSCLQSSEYLANAKYSPGGDAHAREAAGSGNSRLGGTSAEDSDSPNGGTLQGEDLGDLSGPSDDFATRQERLRAELEKVLREKTKSVGVNAGNVEKLVNQDVSGLVEAGATAEKLRQFYNQRQRIPSLGYTTSDYLKWVVNSEKGAGNVSNGTGSTKRQSASERVEQRLRERDYDSYDDQAVGSGAAA
jgi:hypothetical protein